MKLEVAKREGNVHVSFAGNLTEVDGEELDRLGAKLKKMHVVFDLGGVANVNSLGFRHFTTFLRALDASSTFEFRRCPPGLVEYFNLVPRLSFADRIRSVLVPYQCESCKALVSPCRDVEEVARAKHSEAMFCNACNGVMRPVEKLEDYVSFARQP